VQQYVCLQSEVLQLQHNLLCDTYDEWCDPATATVLADAAMAELSSTIHVIKQNLMAHVVNAGTLKDHLAYC
jgi:hypothetical protein